VVPTNRRGARILLAAQSAGIPQDNGRDAAGVSENGDPAYAADRLRVLVHWMRDTPLNPSNLRAPGKPGNVFAVEGFTDEIAAALRVDALEFRTSRLTDPRALEVLKRASTAFGWQPRPSPNPRGNRPARGRAWHARAKQTENYVAMFLEMAVARKPGGSPWRAVCAHDCGPW
jgi:CO/xanthine dehydrogenase Mo-binding subunit